MRRAGRGGAGAMQQVVSCLLLHRMQRLPRRSLLLHHMQRLPQCANRCVLKRLKRLKRLAPRSNGRCGAREAWQGGGWGQEEKGKLEELWEGFVRVRSQLKATVLAVRQRGT